MALDIGLALLASAVILVYALAALIRPEMF